MNWLPPGALIGVVHLPALPGTARSELDMTAVIERAVADVRILAEAGFDAIILENFGDAPFAADRVGPETVAAMTAVAVELRRTVAKPIGINVLRNDAAAAMAIAAITGADFIRVNVHTGVAATDQGIIEGRARETLALRRRLGANVAILADVFVKHAVTLHANDIAQAARDTAYRGLSDGLIVTGAATGAAVDLDDLRRVKAAVSDRPVLAGSGVTADSVAAALAACDGVIVGSALKPDGDPNNAVDERRARSFAAAAGRR